MSGSTLLMAVAIALILEGLLPALFPNKWRNYVLKIADESISNIRSIGITVMLLGLLMLWMVSP